MTARPMDLPTELSGERIASALVGGVLLGYGRRRRDRWGVLAALAGASVLVQAVAAPTVHGIVRAATRRRTVRLRTTLHVRRSVHDVFTFCKDFENFPHVVGALRSVIDYQDGRSHWEVTTPSGHTLEWDALVTKYVPNSVIAWSSTARSSVETTGLLRFAPAGEGGTQLQVELTYTPREMHWTDALLAIAAAPLQAQLERDLGRLGDYLEHQPPLVETDIEDEDPTRLSA